MVWILIAAGVPLIGFFVLRFVQTRRRLESVEALYEDAAKQLEILQTAFHQFTPRDVVEDIIDRGVSTRGERRAATVLFADLVGFTALSETLEPERVVMVLNGYLQAMTRVISTNKGHVCKFIGDGIMAMFGVPEPNPWQIQDAVRAALDMRDALENYNARIVSDGLAPLKIGIGIHTGSVVAGVIGSSELIEYTAIGDVVNTASRIERLTRTMQTDILISDAVAKKLDERFQLRKMQASQVKGKSHQILTWAVDGYHSEV